jgi:type II secretory pathway pseudopilin PulG
VKIRLLIAVAIVGILCSLVLFKNLKELHRLRQHAKGDNVARMTAFFSDISFAAASNPNVFQEAAGTGLVIEATALPTAIWTNFPFTVTPADVEWSLKDSWGNPFHISIVPSNITNRTSETTYVFSIRSYGPNGIDELGFGDDLSFTNYSIK